MSHDVFSWLRLAGETAEQSSSCLKCFSERRFAAHRCFYPFACANKSTRLGKLSPKCSRQSLVDSVIPPSRSLNIFLFYSYTIFLPMLRSSLFCTYCIFCTFYFAILKIMFCRRRWPNPTFIAIFLCILFICVYGTNMCEGSDTYCIIVIKSRFYCTDL